MSRRVACDFPVRIELPTPSLVVLVGASGSGKSTFARTHFLATEVVSSDRCRALVADDENDQNATDDAFSLVHAIAGARLRRGRLTVIDATNVQADSRMPLLALAREHDVPPVAIVLDMPARVCEQRNRTRTDRTLPPHVIRNHVRALRASLPQLPRDGFRHVVVLRSPDEVDAATVERKLALESEPVDPRL